MDSRGVIELHYPDGRVVTGDYEDYAQGHVGRGVKFEFDDIAWLVFDREDRDGVTFFLCRPPEGPVPSPERLRRMLR